MSTPTDDGPDPLAMTEQERWAAQYEAQHDVAARGRRPGSLDVAHYMSATRCHDAQLPPAHRHHAAAPSPAPHPPAPPVEEPPAGTREHWWQRLVHRR